MRHYNVLGIIAVVAAVLAMAAGIEILSLDPVTSGGAGLITAMAIVQSTYSENQAAAYAGMIADMSTADVDSRNCETAAGIGFGLAVGQGSADKGVVLGASGAAVFVGISVRDITLVNDVGDEYQENDIVGVLTRGDIWVTAGGQVAPGNDVTFASTTGVLSSTGTSGSQFAIAGARWMTSAGSGELAIVRLGGALPSA